MKWIVLLLVAPLIVNMVFAVTDYERIGLEMQNLRNQTGTLCDKAIVQYRSEAGLYIDEAKDDALEEINGFLRKQRLLIMVGVAIASFVGSVIGYATVSGILRR